MNTRSHLSTIAWVVGLVLLAETALAQSLSLVRKGESELLLEALAPAQTRFVLQASDNLQLWVELYDAVQGPYSRRLESATGPQRFFRLAPWTPPAPDIRIVLIGDSIASECCGWGQGLPAYFKPNAQVINYAMAWNSTKVFLRSEELDKMLLVKPDVVLVPFGYMETEALSLGRGTTIPEFTENLKAIVQIIRGFNGVPILITPLASRTWDSSGKVVFAWQDRCDVVKSVAAELNTHLIDLNRLSMDLYTQLGESGSKYMEFQPGDRVHSSPEGAKVIAGLVVKALPESLGPYLLGSATLGIEP